MHSGIHPNTPCCCCLTGRKCFSKWNKVIRIASFHLISAVERAPPSPFTSPHWQPNTTPLTPGMLYFSLIFLDIPLGFALSYENHHLLHTSRLSCHQTTRTWTEVLQLFVDFNVRRSLWHNIMRLIPDFQHVFVVIMSMYSTSSLAVNSSKVCLRGKTFKWTVCLPLGTTQCPCSFWFTFVFSLDPCILTEVLRGYWLVMWLNLLAVVCVSSPLHTHCSVLCVQMETRGTF